MDLNTWNLWVTSHWLLFVFWCTIYLDVSTGQIHARSRSGILHYSINNLYHGGKETYISTFASFYGLLTENNINCVKYLNLIFSIFIVVDFYARVWMIWIFVTFDHCVDGPRNVVRWFYEQNKAIFGPFLVSSTYCKIPVDNIQQVFEICCNEINFNK